MEWKSLWLLLGFCCGPVFGQGGETTEIELRLTNLEKRTTLLEERVDQLEVDDGDPIDDGDDDDVDDDEPSDFVGYGRFTEGGDRGEIYHVTTLEDDHENPTIGSLRWVLEKGPRPIRVHFDVSGWITLQREITVNGGFVTLDGSTVKDGGLGVGIRGNQLEFRDVKQVKIGHMRLMPGPGDQHNKGITRALMFWDDCDDLLIYNCLLGMGTDGGPEIYSPLGTAERITVQDCVIAYMLRFSTHPKGEHSRIFGCSVGTDVSIVRCLFAHAVERLPSFHVQSEAAEVGHGRCQMVNNVIYNYGRLCTLVKCGDGNARHDIINNYWLLGPHATWYGKFKAQEFWFHHAFRPLQFLCRKGRGSTPSHVYLSGNLSDYRPTLDEPETDNIVVARQDRVVYLDEPGTVHDFDIMTAADAFDYVLENAGPKPRDALVTKLADDVRAARAIPIREWADAKRRPGRIPNHPDDVGGWPSLAP